MNSVLKAVSQLRQEGGIDSPCVIDQGPFDGQIWRLYYVKYDKFGHRTRLAFKVKELGGFGGPRFVVLYEDIRDQLRIDGLNTRRFTRSGGRKNLCRLLLRATFLMDASLWEAGFPVIEYDERRVANDQLAISYIRG